MNPACSLRSWQTSPWLWIHLKLIKTSFKLTFRAAEVFLGYCLSFLSALAATFGTCNLAFFLGFFCKVGWNFKNLMRLFLPKSAPKHTFHNFQLIELLRPRFVRLLPLLSTFPLCLPSCLQWAQGRRQFMNILQNEVCRLAGYTLEREIICLVNYGLYIFTG